MTNTGYNKLFCRFLILALLISCSIQRAIANSDRFDANELDYSHFNAALRDLDDDRALTIGTILFRHVHNKYHNLPSFAAVKSKLSAAEFLASQMQNQLTKAANRKVAAVAGELFMQKNSKIASNALIVAPAKYFFDTSIELFSRTINIMQLNNDAKKFLGEYYNLKIRTLSSNVAQAGRALAVADPNFKGTHEYVLVLPLLHASEDKPINVKVLPRWMRSPEHLKNFSDACLLHYGYVFHAMMISKQGANLQNKKFNEADFYRNAAKMAWQSNPGIAVNSLDKAIELEMKDNPDAVVAMHFTAIQIWLDSAKHTFAADRAKVIYTNYTDHLHAPRAIWLYYYALSKADKTDRILSSIDQALSDTRTEQYKLKLLYLKWWALRRKQIDSPVIQALEYELLKNHGDDPIVAPILFSQATNRLTSQDYNGARSLLNQLIEKFPSTNASDQAKKMLQRLNKLSR
jgi:hypothetical protein